MNREVNIEKVIQDLKNNYKWALEQEHIVNPIAHALYTTWKQWDRRK